LFLLIYASDFECWKARWNGVQDDIKSFGSSQENAQVRNNGEQIGGNQLPKMQLENGTHTRTHARARTHNLTLTAVMDQSSDWSA